MHIETLKLFADLVEAESFTKAGQLNRITQSAVSQQIRVLEGQFRSLLIERSRKRLSLTREGQVLYEYAKRILLSHDSLVNKLQELKEIVSGTIRVATIYSIGLHDLPAYLKTYLQAYPTVNVQVEYGRADQVYDAVAGDSADIGLVAYPERDPRTEIIFLHQDSLVVTCHPGHPFAQLKHINAADLVGQKFIAFEPDMPIRQAIDRKLAEKKIVIMPVMEFDNIETVKGAVEIGAGISIVPQNTILHEVEKLTLVEVKIEDLELIRPLAAIHKKKRVLTPAMKQFFTVLKN